MSTTGTFPSALLTGTPAEGRRLARRFAEQALAERAHDRHGPAAHLFPPPPTVEALTAAYFQAVASANGGWAR